MKSNHPWRQTTLRAIDPAVNARSSQFAAYLDTLPRDERRQIEAAERAFLARTSLVTNRRQSTAVDFAVGMLGVKENEPVDYRGFVA
jgi:hypothetical protein